jgi:hypothetical protein
MARISVIPTQDGKFGPLNGPFILVDDGASSAAIDALVHFVRIVSNGVSIYNKNEMEVSSLLKSYALECFEELQSDEPDLAIMLENLRVDCSALPEPLKQHPIWKMDRAILRALPGIEFVD